MADFVKVDSYVVSMSAICDAHFERKNGMIYLVIHYTGSHWAMLKDSPAVQAFWDCLVSKSMDVETGELMGSAQ